MNRLQEIEARLAAIANEIEQKGAELTAEQLTAFETEVNNLKTERAGLVAAAEQRNNLLNSIAEGRSGGAVVRTFPSPSSPAGGEQRDEADPMVQAGCLFQVQTDSRQSDLSPFQQEDGRSADSRGLLFQRSLSSPDVFQRHHREPQPSYWEVSS